MDFDREPERMVWSNEDEAHDGDVLTKSAALDGGARGFAGEGTGEHGAEPIADGANFRPGFLVDWPVVIVGAGEGTEGARGQGAHGEGRCASRRASHTRAASPAERRRRRRTSETRPTSGLRANEER